MGQGQGLGRAGSEGGDGAGMAFAIPVAIPFAISAQTGSEPVSGTKESGPNTHRAAGMMPYYLPAGGQEG